MSYKKSKYFIISRKRRIKYFFLNKNSGICVVYFHGFMSDMIGKKPTTIQKVCKKQKVNFLKFEYSGHGKSTGKFVEGNISKWTNEAKKLIKNKTKKKQKLIFIGSSMGSWIALNLFSHFKKKLKAFIGIASAPEFLENLMWKKFNKKIKKQIETQKIFYFKHGEFVYPLTKQLFLDGKKNKILNNKINLKILLVLFHGTKDKSVPINVSEKIFKICNKSKKKLIKIKNGSHSLSRKQDLKKICSELSYIIRS